jgi:hypothetical protein
MPLSNELIAAVKLSDERMYKLAQRAGLHPSMLSHWIRRISNGPQPGDRRAIVLGALVGVPPERCFASEPKTDPHEIEAEQAGAR